MTDGAPGGRRRPPPFSALEIAFGSVLEDDAAPARAWTRSGHSPTIASDSEVARRAKAAYEALAKAVRPALVRGRCLVSFSGGMDSSFVLAVAAAVARADGLSAPVPVILRFTDAPRAEETGRQIAVLDALRRDGSVGEPLVVTIGDELDLCGPVARRMLDLVGPQVPANIYTHLPLLESAAGGTLLTGFGGDQLIGGHGRRFRARSRALAALPPAVEAALRPPADLPWLRPAARRRCLELLTARRRWRLLPPRQRLVREAGGRFTQVAVAGLDGLAVHCGARVEHSLFDPTFLVRLADLLDVLPPIRRTPLYQLLAGDRLPAVITEQHPKAVLSEVFQRSATADAIAHFDPDQLPGDVRELLDVDGLLSVWRERGPVWSNALLLHVALAGRDQPISPLSPLSPLLPPAGPGAG